MVWQDLGASTSLARKLQSCASLVRNDYRFDGGLARFGTIRTVLGWLLCQDASVCMPGRMQCFFGRYRVTWFISSVIRRVYSGLSLCRRFHLWCSTLRALYVTCPLIYTFTFLLKHCPMLNKFIPFTYFSWDCVSCNILLTLLALSYIQFVYQAQLCWLWQVPFGQYLRPSFSFNHVWSELCASETDASDTEA